MLHSIGAFTGRLLRAVIGLAVLAGALVLGFIVAASLLLRLAWLKIRSGRGASPAVHRARRPVGEVIDVEVREVRAR